MFSKLLRPKWKHKNSKIRQQALEAMDVEQDLATITEMARNDADINLRLKALKKINDLDTLLTFLNDDSDEILQLAMQNYCNLMKTAQQLQPLAQAIAKHSDAEKLRLQLLVSINDVELAGQYIDTIDDEDTLMLIINKAKNTDLKLKVLQKIQREVSLKALKNQVSDKRVSQQIRERLKAFKEQKEQEKANIERLEKVCHSLQQLVKTAHESTALHQFTHLVETWESIDSPMKQEYEHQYQQAKQAVADELEQAASDLEQLKAAQTALQIKHSLVKQLQQLDETLKASADELTCEKLESDLEAINQKWQQQSIVEDTEVNQSYYAVFEKLQNYVTTRKVIDEWPLKDLSAACQSDPESQTIEQLNDHKNSVNDMLKPVQWDRDYAKPDNLKQGEHLLHTIKQRIEQKAKEQNKKAGYLNKRMSDLRFKIRNKQLKAANKLFHYLQNEIEKLPDNVKQEKQGRLDKIAEELQELRDWHEFATKPKRAQLCQRMRDLIEMELHPEDRMDRIKHIQEQWRSLSSANYEQDQHLWDEFKQVSDQAFEPCAEYFSQQEAIREQNQQQKEAICQQIEQFYKQMDWSKADWRRIDTIIRTARNEWNDIHNIPYKSAKQLSARFESAMKKLADKLNQERKTNLQARKDILEELDKVLTWDDNNQAIRKALDLKEQWKQCGITFYRDDKKLWSKMQQGLDQLFERKRALNQEQQSEVEQQLDEVQQIIEAIEALSQQQDDELEQSQSAYEALKQEFYDIETLPKKHERKLKQQFDKACERYIEQYQGIATRRKLAELKRQRQASEVCLQLENAIANKESIEVAAIQQQMDDLQLNDPAIQARFELAKTLVEQGEEWQHLSQTHAKQLALLALELEVMADVDSPEAEREARTQYQLELLEQGFQAQIDYQTQLDTLIDKEGEWHSIGIVDPKQRELLQQRLLAVQKKLKTV